MKILIAICFICCFLACDSKPKESSLLSKGIALELAKYRKEQVSDVVYHLAFNIPEQKPESIKSSLVLDLNVNNLEHPLYLDFNEKKSHIKNVKVNHKDVDIKHEEEHLIISQSDLIIGANTIEVSFLAGELSLNRNEDYLYTLLVPDRASTLFPCFDQPNIKANYKVQITAPKEWKVLSGAPLKEKLESDNFSTYNYDLSDKMSTYLFSFVAGVFEEEAQKQGELNMKLLYREDNEDKKVASMDEIFRLHDESVRFLEDYTQYKFPFKKMDFATIPGFQYGGMEHVGAIQYRESSLFLDKSATQNQLLSRGKLIAHETAHMWFGNLVTMEWFDDVWLKEVFANFLADKIANPMFPEINHGLNFMNEHYSSAYSEDRTKGATPIKQPLDNLKNAGTLYGRIIYNKAPIMMRQLEAVLGKPSFRQGMQHYIKSFANANADWNDLVSILDKETNLDLKQWSKVWVNNPGRPIISDEIIYNDNTIAAFDISQKAEDGSENIWPQTFDIGLVYKDSVKVITIDLTERKQSVNQILGLPKPESVIYNYNAFGYGVFPIDALDINTIPLIKDDVARAYSYINLYENMLSSNIEPKKVLEVLIQGLHSETEELILNIIASKTSAVFWKFTSPEQRVIMGEKLETVLKNRLYSKDLDSGFKKTLFNAFKNIAFSESGKNMLYSIWNRDLNLTSLNLNENDYTSLASTLALYNHKNANEILLKAKESITNADRKKRFEFMLASLSNIEEERDVFMESLADIQNREKESWVLSALGNIHHPLRQHSAKKHLKMCLELLEEVQLNGDIFFPKGWLNSTIGKYSSLFAYNTVEQFLLENPKFPSVLKNKLLQSADGIYRANKMNLEQL